MRAFTLDSFDSPPGLREDLPTPEVGPGQLLVRVRASSVNPVDAFIAGGALKGMVEHEFPVVLGRDYAGVVEQAGSAATGYAVGDEVFGFLPHASPRVHDGTWAELILVSQDRSVARRPASSAVAAAGASGGLGSFAVQLAAAAGATVLAPGLPEAPDYLRGLGTAEVLDRNGDVAAQVRERYPDGVDALADFASGSPDQLHAYAAVVRDGGRIASRAGAAGEGPGRTNVGAAPTTENLDRLAGLLEDGTLSVPIQASYPLAQVDQALKDLAGQHTQGKLAVTLP
jgi:NADPH:quinone reductase